MLSTSLNTYTIFRNPIMLPQRIEVFESFLEARHFAREHAEMIEEEVQASSEIEARTKVLEDISELHETFGGFFVAPWNDECATLVSEAGY